MTCRELTTAERCELYERVLNDREAWIRYFDDGRIEFVNQSEIISGVVPRNGGHICYFVHPNVLRPGQPREVLWPKEEPVQPDQPQMVKA